MPRLPERAYPEGVGWIAYDGAFNAERRKAFNAIPGCQWDGVRKVWLIPVDAYQLFPWLQALLPPEYLEKTIDVEHPPEAHDYQIETIKRAVADRRHIAAFDTGLGKSLVAVGLMTNICRNDHFRALIVSPAIVRRPWADQVARWWPNHPVVHLVEKSKDAPALSSKNGITIVSYRMVGKVLIEPWDVIIIDEGHNIANYAAARSKAVRALVNNNPKAHVLELTATPILSEPINLFHQLETVFPERFSNGKTMKTRYWSFARRYCTLSTNQYGCAVVGANKDAIPELEKRLKRVMSRVTKQDVAHLLPPFITVPIRIKPSKRRFNPREVSEVLSSGLRKQHELSNLVESAGDHKRKHIIELVEERVASGDKNICIGVWFKRAGQEIAATLEKAGYNVTYTHGDYTIKKREALIDAAKKQESSILVTTIAAANVGIDLTHWNTVVLAELYWQTAAMEQFAGRFSRLSGTIPGTVYLPILEGSLDEPIAHVLKRRFAEQAKLYSAGQSADVLLDSLKHTPDEEEIVDMLLEAIDSQVVEDYL